MAAKSKIEDILRGFSEICKYEPIRNEFGITIERLSNKLNQPCVLAIAGRVKAGKSSFLNALLGVDLAKVGDTETTATINFFKYGKPKDPTKPIKVIWDSGNETFEDKGFMDSLQGRDEATLKKAHGIKCLEYYFEHDILKEITLVDTPGTDAIVGDDDNAHEERTRGFFKMLRDKHSRQTEEFTHSADAVIYLVGPVPTKAGQNFLNEFQSAAGQSSAINSIGVLAKVDINETLTSKRKEQAEYVASGLKEQLATVIPVSAGLWMVLERFKNHMQEFYDTIKDIPESAFEYFMESEEFYFENDADLLAEVYDGTNKSPLTLKQRQSIKKEIPWSIFRTISNCFYKNASFEEAMTELYDIAGIENVKSILNRTFFKRKRIIQEYNILTGLRPILYSIKNRIIPDLSEQNLLKRDVYSYIDKCPDSRIKKMLKKSVNSLFLTKEEYDNLALSVGKLEREIENVILELGSADKDFEILRLLEKDREAFRQEQYEELCVLFGLYNGDLPTDNRQRLQEWNLIANCAYNRSVQQIAEHAVSKYSDLINNKNK